MLILLSPSKTQDFETPSKITSFQKPGFLEVSKVLARELRTKSAVDIGQVMSISPKLSEKVFKYYQTWSTRETYWERNSKPSIEAFRGDVYDAFDGYSFSKKELRYLSDNVRIVSGLYGMLDPTERMLPYRLEMKTKIDFEYRKNSYRNLYELWRSILTKHVLENISAGEVIINLASKEYSKAVSFKDLPNRKIDIQFKELKDGKPRVVALFAKRMRGQMARWMMENNCQNPEEIKKCKVDGYRYNPKLSTENEWVFLKS